MNIAKTDVSVWIWAEKDIGVLFAMNREIVDRIRDLRYRQDVEARDWVKVGHLVTTVRGKLAGENGKVVSVRMTKAVVDFGGRGRWVVHLSSLVPLAGEKEKKRA